MGTGLQHPVPHLSPPKCITLWFLHIWCPPPVLSSISVISESWPRIFMCSLACPRLDLSVRNYHSCTTTAFTHSLCVDFPITPSLPSLSSAVGVFPQPCHSSVTGLQWCIPYRLCSRKAVRTPWLCQVAHYSSPCIPFPDHLTSQLSLCNFEQTCLFSRHGNL